MSAVRERNILDLAPLLHFDTLRIQAAARAIHRLDETACNRELTPREWQRHTMTLLNAAHYAATHHLEVYHQGDPRGWPLYVYSKRNLRGRAICSCYSDIGVGVCPH